MARGDGGGRDGRGEPEWRPVADVDMMTVVVLEQLGANREQLQSLEPARRAPHLLDDHTVERIKQVFGVQRDDLWLWVETGERWQAQDLNAAEAAKVDQYVAAVEAFAASNTVILSRTRRRCGSATRSRPTTRMRPSWPWLTGLVVGMVAPGEWDIVVTDDRLVEGLDVGGNPVYPVCRRAGEAIRLR
ncbi:hypothetical protein [Nonomuraea sp. 10N515B]|uniref:hypothetical protein n=1 Tax=Nonomuraea sp. 10N515B TaxID=3457422 RepID=UPI003FCC7AAA